MKMRTVLVICSLILPVLIPGFSAGIDGKEARAGARADGPGIEWVNPVPTAGNLYGAAWKDGSDGALLVGQAGTVIKYRPFLSPKFITYAPVITDRLNAVAYQPGGSTALIVGDAGAVLIFDGSSFTPIGSGTRSRLSDCAWKPDGSAALITGDFGTILLFDGTTVTKLLAPTAYNLSACAWAPSLDYALIAGQKGFACRCNLTASSILSTGVSEDLYDIAYKPGGATATVVGADGRVLSFDGQAFQTVSGESGRPLNSVAWSPDGTFALIVGYDNNAHGSSIQKLQQTTLYPVSHNLTLSLRAVIWEPGTAFALIAGFKGLVAEYGQSAVTMLSSGVTSEMDAAAWRSDGSYALVVGHSGYVAKFDGTALSRISSNSVEDLRAAAWRPGDDYALICGRNNEVLRYNASSSAVDRLDPGLLVDVNFTSVSWKPDGSYALFAGDAGKLVRFNGTDFSLQQVVPYPVDYMDVAWRPDGAFALIAGVSSNLLRYEEKILPPYFCVTKVAVSGAPPSTGYFSISWRTWPGIREAMIAGTSGVVVRYNDSGPALLQTEGSYNSYYSIACLPGSEYALAVGTSGRLLLHTGKSFLRPLSSTDTTLLDVKWRPDGAYALILGQSGVLMKYNLSRSSVPQALISSPRTCSVFEPGSNILFDGSNSTPSFGDSISFYWESNISGKMGDGPRFNKVIDPGRHRITLFTNDTHGHSSSAMVSIMVKAPNRAPVVIIDSPTDGQVFNNTDRMDFDASRSFDPDGDPLSFFWTSSRAGALASMPAFNASLNIGAHTITLWVNDSHGYNISRSVNISVVLFNTPPVPVISSPVPVPEQPYTTKDAIRFDATFSRDDDGDALSFYWTSNVSGYMGGTSRFVRSLPAGLQRITVWVDDSRGGNVSAVANISVVSANEPPTLAIDSPVEGAVVFGTVQISGVAQDPEGANAAVSIQVDDGDWQPVQGGQSWTYSLDTLNMSNGKHQFRVRASDGTAESTVLTRNITVHDPFWGFTVAISFPIDGAEVKGKVKLMGTASRIGSSIVQVELRIDNGAWQTVTGTSSWEFAWDSTNVNNGFHQMTVRANDGTDSSPEASITLKVDNQEQAGTPWMAIGAATGIVVLALAIGVILVARRGKGPTPVAEAPETANEDE